MSLAILNSMVNIDADLLQTLFKELDQGLTKRGSDRLHLLLGGAGALVGAYGMSGKTEDVDAMNLAGDFEGIKDLIQEIARRYHLQGDWLNPHFKTFVVYLPKDWKKRITSVFQGTSLVVDALGVEEIIIMKLMAGRTKDQSHILFLLKKKPDLSLIETRLTELLKVWPGLAGRALDLLDDLQDGFAGGAGERT